MPLDPHSVTHVQAGGPHVAPAAAEEHAERVSVSMISECRLPST